MGFARVKRRRADGECCRETSGRTVSSEVQKHRRGNTVGPSVSSRGRASRPKVRNVDRVDGVFFPAATVVRTKVLPYSKGVVEGGRHVTFDAYYCQEELRLYIHT